LNEALLSSMGTKRFG